MQTYSELKCTERDKRVFAGRMILAPRSASSARESLDELGDTVPDIFVEAVECERVALAFSPIDEVQPATRAPGHSRRGWGGRGLQIRSDMIDVSRGGEGGIRGAITGVIASD